MIVKRLLLTLLVVIVPVAGHSIELPDFTGLIKDVSPAVVKITTSATVGGPQAQGLPPDAEVPELFRRFFDPRQAPERNIGGMGSGFIISEDGYVLTNHHVVAGADEIVVRLSDRQEFEAEVVGSDELSDVALLKIDGENLPYLEFAKGDIQVGEWVLAIGSPFGLDFTASQGIVSAVGRDIPSGGGNYVPFIQTDVAINPGNSGGPLFNLDGKVVGVNSQIYTRSGGYMGLSFAIPADVAQRVVEDLKTKGRVERGYLGIQFRDLTRDEATAFGLKSARGALVVDVVKDGPAAEAGIRPGDVIIEFGDTRINDNGDLPQAVGTVAPGTEVPVTLMRERKQQTVDVTVGSLDPQEQVAAQQGDGGGQGQTDRLGVTVENLPTAMQQSLELDGGVVITSVEPGSAAAKAQLNPGDVIVQLGFESISNVEQYQQVMESLPSDQPVPIRFYRQGQPAFTTITIPKQN